MVTGFAGSRTLVCVRSRCTLKKTGKVSEQTRYFLSSQETEARSGQEWIELSRRHWAGVEILNHYRRDATLGEDNTRLHHPRALINLALIRSACLPLYSTMGDDEWLPAKKERFQADPQLALDLIKAIL